MGLFNFIRWASRVTHRPFSARAFRRGSAYASSRRIAASRSGWFDTRGGQDGGRCGSRCRGCAGVRAGPVSSPAGVRNRRRTPADNKIRHLVFLLRFMPQAKQAARSRPPSAGAGQAPSQLAFRAAPAAVAGLIACGCGLPTLFHHHRRSSAQGARRSDGASTRAGVLLFNKTAAVKIGFVGFEQRGEARASPPCTLRASSSGWLTVASTRRLPAARRQHTPSTIHFMGSAKNGVLPPAREVSRQRAHPHPHPAGW
jgi:hypothetical protein